MPEFKDSAPRLEAEAPVSYPTPLQQRLIWTSLTSLAVTLMFGVAGLVFFGFITFLGWSYSVLLPIGLAVIIALVLEPAVTFMQSRGMNRRSATLAVSLLTVCGLLLFWAFLLEPLCSEAGSFFSQLPSLVDSGVDKLQKLGDEVSVPPRAIESTFQATAPSRSWSDWLQGRRPIAPPAPVLPAPPPTNQVATHAVTRTTRPTHASAPERIPRPIAPPENSSAVHDWIKTNLPLAEQSIENSVAHLVYTAVGPVGQALGFILGFAFVPIYVYYFLADRERIAGHWHEYVPLRASPLRNEVVSVLTEINQVLVKYLRGQIIVAGCNGVLTSIGLTLIGIPYSLVLGIMTGVLSIVPFLGVIVSILPALLLGFLSTHGWIRPVLVLVVFALVQMSESMFISPRVQSHSTGLHPLAIIIGILFWSMLLPGLLGPVVAVPLTCAMVVLLRRYVWQTSGRLAERTQPHTRAES